ncbi:hypothetical protein Y032_0180g809 [Ancylostoma ceylanicum]|uniref:Uncharacterized protein n=1 Tax=Ancylostoma ceylanicum TaxID=53326 RepID=A0A016SSI3_9BILA|nr:hypothetical protein Y032_0180g809 [Ancylostoma ceylanicum]
MGVAGADPFAASRSTPRDRAAHNGIVVVVANLGFLDSCSSHSMSTNKKTNWLSRTLRNLMTRRGFLLERRGRAVCFSRPQTGHRHRRLLYFTFSPNFQIKKFL